MYRPTLHSNLWLGIMTVAFLALFFWAENSVITVRPDDYSKKLEAAKTMNSALQILQDYRLPNQVETGNADVQDPLSYTMLGEKDSPITTDEGRIQDKVTVLNPNFAAIIVDMFSKAELTKGDTVAVMVTGSMPGANLAVFSAMKSFGLNPVIITSVGSSWWGANSPDFTWLDMETVLFNQGIFPFISSAASAGGSDDEGGLRLSDVGKQLIADAVIRNEQTYIHQGSLTSNIKGRMEFFKRKAPLSNYKAVINVGGGIAALGHHANANLIPDGFLDRLPVRNYPNRGVIHYFASENVPIIQIYDVTDLAKTYGLPQGQLPPVVKKSTDFEIGKGEVFEIKRYNLLTSGIALGLMLLILIVVKYFDHQHFKWREEQQDPDSIV